MTADQRCALRAGFNCDADAYQRTRPVCPPQLFDDLVALALLERGARIAEIGPGTGQATIPLAERGMTVTGIELGAELAAIARRRLADGGFESCQVLTGSFEDWEPEQAGFDAVVAVSCLHWIDPELRHAKPARILRPGGALAVAGCLWSRPADAEPFWAEVQEDYLAVGYEGSPPPPPEDITGWRFPAEAVPYFEQIASRRYPPAQLRYSADDYLAQLATQSGTRALGPERMTEFLRRVRRRLDDLGSPELTATFVAYLTVGRRR